MVPAGSVSEVLEDGETIRFIAKARDGEEGGELEGAE
jgi:hypothetical protein